jgi:hypothetical protein
MDLTHSVAVDTYYDTFLNKSSNLGDYISGALDLEFLIQIWLNTRCSGKFEFVLSKGKQMLCFEQVEDYTAFCLIWC